LTKLPGGSKKRVAQELAPLHASGGEEKPRSLKRPEDERPIKEEGERSSIGDPTKKKAPKRRKTLLEKGKETRPAL